MSSGRFSDFLARVRSLRGLPELAAKEAAPLVEKAMKANVAKGLDPSGKPWPATKKGDRPLANAADAVTVEARGASVVVKLAGVEVFHNFGVTDGPPKRQIIPSKGEPIPAFIRDALEEGAARAYRKLMGAA